MYPLWLGGKSKAASIVTYLSIQSQGCTRVYGEPRDTISRLGFACCKVLARHRWQTEGVIMPQETSDANEANEKELKNTMVVRRRAAQVGERWRVWKVNSIPNAKTNASKLTTTTFVFMGWAWNTESASFRNFKSVRLMSSETLIVRRARMALR